MRVAALPALPPPVPVIAGQELERLLKVWNDATREQRAQMIRMVFEAIYIDTVAKEIVAYPPKEPHRALFLLCEGLREDAGLLVTERYAQLAGFGKLEQP